MAPSFHQFVLGFLGLVVAGAGVAATVFAYRAPQQHTVGSVATGRRALLPPPAPAAVPRQPEPHAELPNGAFDLDAIAGGAPVPRPTVWPDETAADETGGRSRQEFLELVLPLALLANEAVVGERMRLWEVLQRNNVDNLTSEDRLWLAHVSDRYNVQEGDFPELVQRVDIVPPSILIAVAAWSTQWNASNEAGWLSLFRSAVTATQGASEGSRPGKQAQQPSPLDALHLYTKMANTHPDFLPFRRARERLRQTSAPLRGSALMATLPRIAPGRLPGALAVFDLISDQQLERFDSASLAPR